MRERLFRILRIALGLIWLYHAWNASSAAGNTALAGFLGLPMSSWVVHLAGTGVVPVDLYIAPVMRRDVSRGAGVIEPPWDPEWHA